MKLKKGFVTYDTDGEQLMVAAGSAAKLFHGMVRSNETGAFIVNKLKNNTSVDEIVAALCSEYDVDAETAKRDVTGVIDKLRGIGAIDD